MEIAIWIAFGAVAGGVAHMIDTQRAQGGLLGAMLLGVLGALTGGFLANLFFGPLILPFDLTSFVVAMSISLLLLLVHRTVFLKRY